MSLRLRLTWISLNVFHHLAVLALVLYLFHPGINMLVFGLKITGAYMALAEFNEVLSNWLLDIENERKLVWQIKW